MKIELPTFTIPKVAVDWNAFFAGLCLGGGAVFVGGVLFGIWSSDVSLAVKLGASGFISLVVGVLGVVSRD